MERLKTAAPPAIFEGATVVDMKEDGSMAVLRKWRERLELHGSEDGTAPMCADANAMEWLHALMSKGPAPQKPRDLVLHAPRRWSMAPSNTDP